MGQVWGGGGARCEAEFVFQIPVQKSPRLITKEVRQFAEDMQAAVDEFGVGGLSGEALELRFKKLEANIPDLVAQHRGQRQAEDPRVGDKVWVPRLSGEAVVKDVSGERGWCWGRGGCCTEHLTQLPSVGSLGADAEPQRNHCLLQ